MIRTVKEGDLMMLKYLIKSGVDINSTDGEDRTILHYVSILF